MLYLNITLNDYQGHNGKGQVERGPANVIK
jgi:hypothetical protein